jgi:hypothetical protein
LAQVFNDIKKQRVVILICIFVFFIVVFNVRQIFSSISKLFGFKQTFNLLFNVNLFLEIKTSKKLFTKHLKCICFDRVSVIFAKMQI